MRFVPAVIAVTLSLVATAQAATVIRESAPYAVGADVTATFPGVSLTRQHYVSGGALIVAPTIIASCTTFSICSLTPLKTFGANSGNLFDYRDCYNALRRGIVSSACGRPHDVLVAEFTTPTDYVEFDALWEFDPPAMIAYDAAGNEVATCYGGGTGTCGVSMEIPTRRAFGSIRIALSSPIIKRVIVGTPSGASLLKSIRYDVSKPCKTQ